jgi:hypothetical protein
LVPLAPSQNELTEASPGDGLQNIPLFSQQTIKSVERKPKGSALTETRTPALVTPHPLTLRIDTEGLVFVTALEPRVGRDPDLAIVRRWKELPLLYGCSLLGLETSGSGGVSFWLLRMRVTLKA